jgi:hypothetical protein
MELGNRNAIGIAKTLSMVGVAGLTQEKSESEAAITN